MALSITDLLNDPSIREAAEAKFGKGEVATLLTPAAIKKSITESLVDLTEPEVLAVLIKLSLLIMAEELESEYLDNVESISDFLIEVMPGSKESIENLSLLPDTELKLLVKTIAKHDMFAVRKRVAKVTEATPEVAEDCPLDGISTPKLLRSN